MDCNFMFSTFVMYLQFLSSFLMGFQAFVYHRFQFSAFINILKFESCLLHFDNAQQNLKQPDKNQANGKRTNCTP